MRIPLWIAAAFAVVACANVDVSVDLKRDGSQHRSLSLDGGMTTSHGPGLETKSAPPESLLAAPRKHYRGERKVRGEAVAFEGTFADGPPPDLVSGDVANRGATSYVESSLGAAYLYRESLPGRTDHFAAVSQLGDVVDASVRILVRAAEDELEGERGLDRLVVWLKGPFRRDMKDLAVLLYAASVVHQSAIPTGDDAVAESAGWITTALAVVDFLEERGYVDPKRTKGRLPAFVDIAQVLDVVRVDVARRMGRAGDEALAKKLARYTDEDSDAFKKALDRAREELEIPPETFENAPVFLLVPFVQEAGVTFRLRFEGRRPVLTNGRWDDVARAVEWAAPLTARQAGRPLVFAIWTIPNEEWQRKHLGVAVDGTDLLAVLVSEALLDGDARAEWTRCLEALRPDDEESLAALRELAKSGSPAKNLLEALKRAKEKR